MKKSFALFVLSSLCLLLASSCEDKALVKKNQELRERISELEKEVDVLQINAGEDPGDQTEAIEKANKELRQALAELEKLDAEKEQFEADHAKMEKELREYQKKYRVE